MAERQLPAWFNVAQEAIAKAGLRIEASVADLALPRQVKMLPLQAHWFMRDSLFLASQANQGGMHANALALTRQCLEAISIIELGLSSHPVAADLLAKWDADKASPGEIRKWLSGNVWPSYGSGLWSEPWSDYMAKLASAIQPYAHYTSHLARWQTHLLGQDPNKPDALYIRVAPRAYDPQKATRITLYHTILTYTLARIWVATKGQTDVEFTALTNRLGRALGQSKYLDGHQTNWDQQFWALLWTHGGGTELE